MSAPRTRWTEFFRLTGSGLSDDSRPASLRLEQNLRDYDAGGEKAIAVAQGAICCFILVLHVTFRLKSGVGVFHSWLVPFA